MLPLLMFLTAAALTAALYHLIWGIPPFWRKKKPAAGTKPGTQAPVSLKPHVVFKERSNDAIDQIAARISFSSAPVVIANEKVGERLQRSPMPTDEMEIRQFESMTDIPCVLPSAMALPDEVFYPSLAAGDLPVRQYLERVDVREDIMGPPRNVVVLLEDVSDSMKKKGRIQWAIRLGRKVIERAQAHEAEVAILPFNSSPKNWRHAKTPTERSRLTKDLAELYAVGGGTDIDAAMWQGINLLKDPSYSDRKLVLVTDGTQAIDAESLEAALKEYGIELHTVLIGPDNKAISSISTYYDLFPD
jgi:uncharacterized protein with von Willebrand factor type A (vWA) domain